jgi:hypothetical protein
LGHDLGTQCQYEHNTKRATHLNTTNVGLLAGAKPENGATWVGYMDY